ncbi:MAG TPA: transcription elongation factor GreA [Aggregatilineales bacterium]|jgi:transcription elongation factor GreA|nr:transcription elongation factor GreA [Aggregatilineales bacterium]
MADEVYLTPDGKADLERELEELVTVRRPDLAQKLKEAVADGDLKENANYHDAKEKQAFLEGRIQYLENILRSATIIQHNGATDQVRIGSTVTIREAGSDEDETFKIVGAAEANPRDGKISQSSPIGSALLGHKKGDKVKAQTPNGTIVFEIRKIK